MNSIYYGDTQCSAIYKSGKKKGKQCDNNAYYDQDGSYLCGVHSKKEKRKELKKNPNAAKLKQELLKQREILVFNMAMQNEANHKKGDIICSKFKMMQESEHFDGYLKVFPNFKHNNRKDGFGCSSLSPKSLGPVEHNQPGLPIALNLENFHQASKCFESELKDGVPGSEFYVTQIAMFKDSEPHRHKKVAKEISGNKNICKFWIWKTQDGIEKRFSYLECRQFYCNFYERLVVKEKQYSELLEFVAKGFNIQIIGYDGYDVNLVQGDTMAQKLDMCYNDTTRPFGHKLVLFSMLTLKLEDYPWRRYKTENF